MDGIIHHPWMDWRKTIFNPRCCKLRWPCLQSFVVTGVWQQLSGLSWHQLSSEVSV